MKQFFPFLAALAVVAVLALVVTASSWLSRNTAPVTTFDECAAAGNPVLESYPAQCNTPDGRHFVQEIPPEDRWKVVPPSPSCSDRCGDGACQEVVCMAIGCPCSESVSSCPRDCAQGISRTQCSADEDCLLVDQQLGFNCCWAGACEAIDYSEAKWVAVNRYWFERQKALNCPSEVQCGPAPMCAVRVVNSGFAAKCVQGTCVKIASG